MCLQPWLSASGSPAGASVFSLHFLHLVNSSLSIRLSDPQSLRSEASGSSSLTGLSPPAASVPQQPGFCTGLGGSSRPNTEPASPALQEYKPL